ncbi:S-layer homology domain-containing protein [Brachybacterium sp. GCM10030267]|uniref:S-layer homology domain-containing protein n=1 Tax=Brachybacterium sp. GCM10030267 TaxID=3273381 RepID=UPI00360C7E95
MPLASPARIFRLRPVRVVGWTALAFAGLTITSGLAHAEEASPPAPSVAAEAVAAPEAQHVPTEAHDAPATPSEAPPEVPASAADAQDVPPSPVAKGEDEDEQTASAGEHAAADTDGRAAARADEVPPSEAGQAVPQAATGEAGQAPPEDASGEADQALKRDTEAETDRDVPTGAADVTGQDAPAQSPEGEENDTVPAAGTDSDTAPVGPENPRHEDADRDLAAELENESADEDPAADAETENAGENSATDAEDENPAEELVTDVEDEGAPADADTIEDDVADTAEVPEAAGDLPLDGPGALPASMLVEQRAFSVTATSSRRGFTDVPAGMMYADEILWMQREGYATGWPDGTYRPLEDINRDAFVAMIYRVHAPTKYVAPQRSRFVDVGTDNMYYREISWAAQQGITTGWSDGTFRPLDSIDRDAALAMMQRSFGGGVPAPSRSPFTDVTPRTQHYGAMAWGYANGVTTGWSDGSFRPQDGIHRDAMAVMMHRLVVLGPDSQRGLTSGPTGTHWASHGGSSLIGKPSGYQYRYGSGLRQDFAGGSVLYSPSSNSAVIIRGEAKRLYDARGGQAGFGMPITPQISAAGSTALQFAEGGIYSTDGFTFVVTGAMYDNYRSLGGVRSYLGAPIGNQRTGSSGITYQSFKGGQLTSPTFHNAPPPTTVSGGTRISYRTLASGARGDDVYAVQVKVGATADGKFGPQTRAAVMRYQREQGLPATGIVDMRTWARIMSVPNQRFDGTNGRLAANQLTVIAPNWTLPNQAAAAFTAMQRAFTAATGRTFTLNDAYRPIDRQIQLLVALGRPTAAFAGTSPHGDARRGAVDIQVTRGDVTHRWLVANASRYGFGQTSWQARNEPWHWERR